MRLGLDLDGVLYNWWKPAAEAANNLAGKKLLDPEEEPDSWYKIEETYGEDIYRELFNGDTARRVFGSSRPYFGAGLFVAHLMQWHDVRVMTVRPPEVRSTTLHRWNLDFGTHGTPSFFFADKFLQKGEFQADVYIEDHPESHNLALAWGRPVILLDRPCNQKCKGPDVYRVKDYIGIMNKIGEMENAR